MAPKPMHPIVRALLIVVGALWFLTMLLAWLLQAHNGYINAFAQGLFGLAGWVILISGLLARAEERRRRGVARIGGVLVVVAFTALGPTASTRYLQGLEAHEFAKLEDEDTDLEAWAVDYEEAVPPAFRRDGWQAAWFKTRVDRALARGDAPTVQALVDEIDRIGGPGSGAARARAMKFLAQRDGKSTE